MVTLESEAKIYAHLNTKTFQPAGGLRDVGVNMHAGLRGKHAFICIVWECKCMYVIPMFIINASGLQREMNFTKSPLLFRIPFHLFVLVLHHLYTWPYPRFLA